MPVLGLGTWTQDDETTANSVYCALKNGYRLIDTAQYYGNEAGVGDGVRKAISEGIVKREDVFITSKVMPMNYDNAYSSITKSNEKIGLGYIDLMLIHQSGSNDKQVYRALEQAVKDGTVRSIGISNYYTKAEFDRITEGAEIMPAVVQNENHDTRTFLNAICLKNNIRLKTNIVVDRHALIVEFVKKGLGIGFATKEYIQEYLNNKELVVLDTNIDIEKRYINCVYRNNRNIKINKFIDLLKYNIKNY